MGALLSFSVIGEEQVKQGIAALMATVKDLRPFWRDVLAPKYYGQAQDLFATSGRLRAATGRFQGGAWAPLSPRYRVWKEKHYGKKPILVREGTLRESVRWRGKRPGPGGIFVTTPSWAVLGTSVPYGQYHMTGTKKMPARPFLPPISPAVYAPLLQQWIMKTKIVAQKKGKK